MNGSARAKEADEYDFVIRSGGLPWFGTTGAVPPGMHINQESREAALAQHLPPHGLLPDAQRGASACSRLQLFLEAMEFCLVIPIINVVGNLRR